MAGKAQKVQFADQEVQELACTYAALILSDAGLDVKSTQIEKLVKFTGIRVEPFWPKVYEKALKGKSVSELLQGGEAPAAGSAPVAASGPAKPAEAPKKEEPKKVEKAPEPEEDVDMGGLFDF